MASSDTVTILSNKQEIELQTNQILYIQMKGNYAFIHITKNLVYQTRMTMAELEELLDERFIKVKRGCLVSAMAVHKITDKIILSNGETLDFVARNKKEIIRKLHEKQTSIIQSFSRSGVPDSDEAFHEHYRVFDTIPIAFADIEMVFDEKCHAIDWVFRYGNPALAKLEKLPLETLIGSSFSSLFPNMDQKWLIAYEHSAVFGETLKLVDYSPEIDTYLDVICFPTFKGHCGCFLFDISQIKVFRETTLTEKALVSYLEKLVYGI